jgi:fucose 4-O-acetylase-like acetyltransferase
MDFILFHAQALSSIIAFFTVARIMPSYSFLQYLGRNSMLLFGAHFVVYQAFDLVNRKLRLDTPEPILSLYVVVTALAVLVPCCEVVNRYFPWVVGNRSRCRKPL